MEVKIENKEIEKAKEKIYMIITIVILLIIGIFGILYIFTDKKEFSENENRYLQEFPEFTFEKLLEGEYIKSLEEYFVDHIFARDIFMGIKTSSLQLIGQDKINGIYICTDDFYIEEYKVEVFNTQIPFDILNTFEESLNENVETTLMLIPTATQIYNDKLPKLNTNTSQKEVIDYIYSNINFNTIYIYDELMKNKEEHLLYYKLDHHWTSFGAEIAYQEYMKSINKEYISYELDEIANNFYGTIYSKLNGFNAKPDSIYAISIQDNKYILSNPITKESYNNIYFEEFLDEKDKYSYFLGTNQPILKIENIDNKVENKIVIIKDSYAHSFIPFILENYSEIYIIDPRYYKEPISEFVNSNEIDEVLIMYNMNTIETDLGIRSIK